MAPDSNSRGARRLTWPAWNDLVTAGNRLTAGVTRLVLPDHELQILRVRPYHMPRGWAVQPHEHSFYECNLILAGCACDDGPARQVLGPGDVYFHGPNTVHSWRASRASCRRLIVWFNVEPPVPVAVPERWPHWPELLHDTAAMLRLALAQRPGWRDNAGARMAALLAQALTLGRLATPPVAPVRTGELMLQAVDAFLNDNLIRPVRLDDVAAMAGVSASTLTHRYRALAGVSVGQRLIALRMERAAQLLRTTDLPLKAVCARVGVTDPAYLCRLFRRYFRQTPAAYRAAAAPAPASSLLPPHLRRPAR